MSWLLNASGHDADIDAEALTLDTLRLALVAVGATEAQAVTSFHGEVDVLALDPLPPRDVAALEEFEAFEQGTGTGPVTEPPQGTVTGSATAPAPTPAPEVPAPTSVEPPPSDAEQGTAVSAEPAAEPASPPDQAEPVPDQEPVPPLEL